MNLVSFSLKTRAPDHILDDERSPLRELDLLVDGHTFGTNRHSTTACCQLGNIAPGATGMDGCGHFAHNMVGFF